MALPACRRCGKTDPKKMFGLMTHWFGPFVDVPPDHGYFYLCSACYDERVREHLEAVQGKLAELHPAAARQLEQAASQEPTESEPTASSADRARAADAAARRSAHKRDDPPG